MQSNKKSDMAIIVSSPDSYSDIFDIFIDLFNKNWPDCRYEVILSNNSKQFDYDKVTVLNNGEDVTWSVRVLHAARQVDVKYILLITDDSLISSPIDSAEMEKILRVMKDNSLRFYRLYSSPKASGEIYKGIGHIHHISKRQPYGLNLMAAIWNKDYFIDNFGEGEYTGWDIEGKWLKETMGAPNENIEGCVVDDRNILHIVHGVSKGKWMPSAIQKFRKQGYMIDVGERGSIPVLQEFISRLKAVLRNWVSGRSRRNIKAILSKFGIRFATRY